MPTVGGMRTSEPHRGMGPTWVILRGERHSAPGFRDAGGTYPTPVGKILSMRGLANPLNTTTTRDTRRGGVGGPPSAIEQTANTVIQ